MSGYLQRLASSVMNPGGSIYPVVGSVFSTPKLGRAPDIIQWGDEVISRDHVDSVVKHRSEGPRRFEGPEVASAPSVSAIPPIQSPPLASEQPRRNEYPGPFLEARVPLLPEVSKPISAERSSLHPVVSKPTSEERSSARPVVSKLISEARASLHPEVSKPTSEERTSFKPDVTRARQPEIVRPGVRALSGDNEAEQTRGPIAPRRQPREQEVFLESVYTPLLPEPLRGTVPPSVIGDKPNSLDFVGGTREKRDDSRRGVGLPEREPDEIQIHIGRIEVTAVPPAQAPMPARSAPKSASLSDYLKRRDARAL
jgi:hypothetical protein